MMNLFTAQEQLRDLSKGQLVQEMQSPSGSIPPFLIMTELQRRTRMESAAALDKGPPQTTVMQDTVNAAGVPQGGLATMAQAMAPQTSMAQNDSAVAQQGQPAPQAAPAAAPVQQMQEGGLAGIKRNVSDYGVLNTPGSPGFRSESALERARMNAQRSSEANTPGEGLSLMDILSYRVPQQEVGFVEGIGKPVVEALLGPAQPTVDMSGSPSFRPESPSRPATPLTYEEIITRARAGVIPTEDQLVRSVEANLLTDQQASDVQAMTERTGYVPTDEEMGVAALPGMAPPSEYSPPVDTPYMYAKQGVGDWVAGALGGRTIAEQSAIDAERAALLAAQRSAEGLSGETDTPAADPSVPDVADPLAPNIVADPLAPVRPAGPAGLVGANAPPPVTAEDRMFEQDKWLALARFGAALAASKAPTFGQAMGEAGQVGLDALGAARADYQKRKQEAEIMAMKRAAASGRGGGGGGGGGGLKGLTDFTAGQARQLEVIDNEIAKIKQEALGGYTPGFFGTMMGYEAERLDPNTQRMLDRLQTQRQYIMNSAVAPVGTMLAPTAGGKFDATK